MHPKNIWHAAIMRLRGNKNLWDIPRSCSGWLACQQALFNSYIDICNEYTIIKEDYSFHFLESDVSSVKALVAASPNIVYSPEYRCYNWGSPLSAFPDTQHWARLLLLTNHRSVQRQSQQWQVFDLWGPGDISYLSSNLPRCVEADV